MITILIGGGGAIHDRNVAKIVREYQKSSDDDADEHHLCDCFLG